jgi:hypothetical protein
VAAIPSTRCVRERPSLLSGFIKGAFILRSLSLHEPQRILRPQSQSCNHDMESALDASPSRLSRIPGDPYRAR